MSVNNQCFQNRTGSRFIGRIDGRTAVEPVTSLIYIFIIIKFLKKLINKNNKFHLNFDSIYNVC